MDRVRDGRRGAMTAVSNGGLSRRRQRNSSLRDSPEEDGPGMELPEIGGRLRERPVKKERERERDRELRDREREHERERDRSSRSKRRKGEMRVPQGGGHHRDDGGDETTDESMGDDDDDDDDMGSAPMTRLPPPPPVLNHHHHHHHPSSATSFPSAAMGPSHHRKSFPPKIVRAVTTPPTVKTTTDEIIHFTVPRKARSASVKRSHESWSSGAGGGGGDPALRPPTSSPARASSSQAAVAAPISPSSPNASVKKKLKHATPGKQQHHHRPPKNSKTPASSSIQDDIEIEVAEVLYGLKTSSKQEAYNPKDSYDAKSRVSSPSSTIPPVAGSAGVSQNTLSMANSSTTVIAPKRKKPRPIKYDEEIPATAAAPFSTPNTSTTIGTKSDAEPASSAISSPKLEKTAAAPSAGENAGKSELTPASAVAKVSEVAIAMEVTEAKDKGVAVAHPQSSSHAKLEADMKDSSAAPKSLPAELVVESAKVEKFKIDLMAPPSAKSSPERDGLPDSMVDQKSVPSVTEVATKIESVKSDEKEKVEDRRSEERKVEAYLEAQKINGGKLRTLQLQLEFDQNQEKYDDGSSKKQPSFNHKAPPKVAKGEPSSVLEKSAQSSSVTAISMAMGGWPGGLPPMGYMGQVPPIPVPSIVPLSGNSAPSATIQPPYFLLGQSRSKRCATHFYIAQNIHYHEQLARMNPFWPTGAGSAPIYGSKPYNLNVVPPSESAVLGNQLPIVPLGGRSTSAQDKTPVASFPGQQPKEKISSPAVVGANLMDANQRKQQYVLHQGPQHGGSANNMLGPTFIFPLNQQQAAAAATARSSSVKSNAPVNNGAPAGNGPNPVPGAVASSVSAAPPATMGFNFASMAPNEAQAQAQYLAILQNGGYPFPIPAHVGAPPSFRGSHSHPVPFFNGSFFSSQMLHPSHLQQQQQSQTQPATPPVGHHTSTSSGSSSSQKQQQQHRAPGMGNSGGQTGSNNFPSVKPRPPMPTHQLRQFDSESGVEESPSAGDNRASHAQKSPPVVYNHNFAMPIPQNFALLSPAAMAGHGDKNQQQQLPPNLKGGMEVGPSQFAMSFASPAGLDFSAVTTPNHPLFQSLPDATRHQMTALAAAAAHAAVAQRKKTTEESKVSSDSLKQHTPVEEDRKRTASSGPHSLPLTRADANDSCVSGNSGLEGSKRTLNLNLANGSQNSRVSTGASTSATSTVLTPAMGNYLQQQMQKQQQQLQLQNQPQLQHQIVGRSKPNASSHSPAYPDRLAGGGKFQNPMSAFPPALMQTTNSPNQSPQWKASMSRPSSAPVPSSSTATSTVKGLPQPPGIRVRQPAISASNHSQISFSVSPKSVQPGQQFGANSPPSTAVGSPTARSGGGVSASKPASVLGSGPASTSQTTKNSSTSTRKSSPGSSGRNATSMPSNAHMAPSQNPASKPLQQQLQQQQQKAQPYQQQGQAQLFFTNTYLQSQSPQSTTSNYPSGHYQRKQQEQLNSPQNSTGMLSLSSSPLALPGGVTSDPTKVVAAAAGPNNIKGLAASGIIHTGQFQAQSAGGPHPYMSIPYLHTLPAVPVKSTDPRPPATGNDNLRTSWQPEKR